MKTQPAATRDEPAAHAAPDPPWQPPVSDAAERFLLPRHRVVSAGAGTGKTYALVTQYLHLVLGLWSQAEALPPRAIATLTFTEKAATELRARIDRKLCDLLQIVREHAPSEEELPWPAAAALVAAVSPELAATMRLLRRGLPARQSIERSQRELARAPIGTFHAFAWTMLRRHSAQAGIDANAALLDERDSEDLLEGCCEAVVLETLEGRAGDRMALAVEDLLVEFPLTGTEGLLAAVGRLVKQRLEEASGQEPAALAGGYAPEVLQAERERLALDVTHAHRRLQAQQAALGPSSAEKLRQATQDLSALPSLLRQPGRQADAVELGRQIRSTLSRFQASPKADPDDKAEITAARTLLFSVLEAIPVLGRSERAAGLAQTLAWLLVQIEARVEEWKTQAGVLDFGDLLRKTRDLLRTSPSVLAAEQARLSVLLVDEFQDTSPLQAEILQHLLGISSSPTDHEASVRRLYLVGDRKQSIYGFRGADVRSYEQLCRTLIAGTPGADEETLGVSWRSRPALVELANALFARVFQAPEEAVLTTGSVQWDPHRDVLRASKPAGERDEPLAEILVASEPTPGADATTEDASSAWPEDASGREARLVAQRILMLFVTGVRPRQVVLLLRQFTHVLRYTAVLEAHDIPFYVVRGRGLYQAQEILDIVSALTLVDDPSDRLALVAVLRSPLCGLSDETLVRLQLREKLTADGLGFCGGAAEGGDLDDLLPSDEANRLDALRLVLRQLIAGGDRLGPVATLEALLDATDYLAVLAAGPGAAQRVANVRRLQTRAQASEDSGDGLRAYVRQLRRDADPRVGENGEDAMASLLGEDEEVVRIMTIHQSKGLEFDHVVVAGCGQRPRHPSAPIAYDREVGVSLKLREEGEWGDTLASQRTSELQKARALAEHGRLFYVAATRAAEGVYFVGEGQRRAKGRSVDQGSAAEYVLALAQERPELIVRRALSGQMAGDRTQAIEPTALPMAIATDWPASESGVAAAVARCEGQVAQGNGGPLAPVRTIGYALDALSCARRVRLRQGLGYRELDRRIGPLREDDLPGELALGRLAAELLTEINVSARGQDLLHALRLRGEHLREPGIGELHTRLLRLLSGEEVPQLVARWKGRLLRGQVVEQSLGALRIAGTLDWLLVAEADVLRREDPTLCRGHVIQFRFGQRPSQGLREQRLLTLLGWLAREQLGGTGRVLVTICDLREADPSLRPQGEISEEGGAQLLAWQKEAQTDLPTDQRGLTELPVLDRRHCQALDCGFVSLCHGAAREPTAV